MRRKVIGIGLLGAIVSLGLLVVGGFCAERGASSSGTLPPALPPAAVESVDFARDVWPILVARCHSCHGAQKQRGDLRLDLREAALEGGLSADAIVPAKSEESLLIRLVAGLEGDKVMPPKGERLDPREIAILRAWIDAGAVWPDRAGVPAIGAEGQSEGPAPSGPPPSDGTEAVPPGEARG